MTVLIASPASGGVFTRAQALAAGVSEDDVRRLVVRGEWLRIRRGAYTTPEIWAAADLAERHALEFRAVSLQLEAPVVGSHETAAAVLGIELWKPSYDWINVTRPHRSPRREGRVWHHQATLLGEEVASVDGLLVTSVHRTAFDLARHAIDHEHAVVAVDSALRSTGGNFLARASALETLRRMHSDRQDWPRSRQAGAALAAADPRSGSVGESRTRVAFAKLHLPSPMTQVCIYDEDGYLVGISDFAFIEQKTLGEFDGRLKYGLDGLTPEAVSERLWSEKARQDRLDRLGWQMARVVWADLSQPARIGTNVGNAFDRAASTGPVRGSFRLATG